MDDDQLVFIELTFSENGDFDSPDPRLILIVDDDHDVRHATVFTLRDTILLDRPLQFLHAYSGKETVEILRDNPGISLILLDAVMAISTLKEGQKNFAGKIAGRLRKSDLDHFLQNSGQGLEIAERKVNRAADLVSSFKRVVSDRASSVRRKFELSEMMWDVLLTLHPMLKRSPPKLVTDIEEGLTLDGYPGVIGQIVTNLITNALMHAWDEDQKGTLTTTARSTEDGGLRISVADDGRGIPEAMRARVFAPFFTTRMGRGGTGLGLNIAHNGAGNVLGGNLDFESASGQ